MSPFSGPNGIWWKFFALLLPLVVGAIVAFTRVQSGVAELRVEVQSKASRDVTEANQAAIIRELNQIEAQLNRLESRAH